MDGIKYRKNEEMMDSGIDWLGNIPQDWDVTKIKFNTYVKGRIGWQGLRADEFIDNGPFLVTGTDFINDKVNWATCYHISDERYKEAPEIHLKDNDLLITKDGSIGKLAIVKDCPDKATLNSGIFLTRCNNDSYVTKYMLYLLSSKIFSVYIDLNSNGSTIQHLYQATFINFSFVVPKIPEQKKIANFLDIKTAQFDSIIDKKELLIEKLEEAKKSLISEVVTGKVKIVDGNIVPRKPEEMNESYIDWLGMVPKDWTVKKIKHVVKYPLKYGANESAEQDDPQLPRYIRITDFGDNGKLNDGTFKSLDYKKARDYLLMDGDILFARSGATFGKTYQFKGYKGLACFAGYLIKAVPNQNLIFSDMLYLFTRSKNYDNWKNAIFIKATIQNIGADKYKELKLCVPTLSEQRVIIEFINKERASIDSIIEKTSNQLNKLKQAKQSLISEAVTGKIDLRDWEIIEEGELQ